jgi:hypothetical protein
MQKSVIVETQKRYAVCIGINHYVDSQGMPALRYAEKDAQAVYELLLQRGFAPENCRLLLGSQATQQAIHNALKSVMLDNPRKEDLVLFYFAGHGVPISFEDDEEDDVLTDVFLTCFDFPLQEIRAIRGSWLDFPLRLERLRTQFFERTRSKKVLIILDSGHSGDFYGPKYRGGETVAHGHIDQAFGRMSAGRVVLSSCMPQQKAYEDEKRQHGRFTYYLLDALEGKQRNAVGRDGWMTVSSLFDYVAKTMHGEQCPVESGVKHGSFELLYYPAFDEKLAIATKPTSPEAKRAFHLRALFANHQRFLRDRLASFVGREKELAEIRALITLRQQTGGYLTITGCELKDLSLIWRNTLYNEAEQDRRLYARYYYLTHLYEARQWERLFEELDAGQYGQSKLHFDPGMRLYTQDLNYGCKAAAWEGWTLEEGMALLPCLWRYTLLRCSLQSRANAYPPTAFKFLVVMGQEQKALALTELITTSDEKAKALLAIAQQMSVQPGQERERILQVLLGAYDAAKAIAWPAWRAEVLREVAEAFMDMQQWGQAREVIDEITVHWQRARALGEMGRALAQAGDGERAEAIWAKAEEAIGAIEWMHEKIEALSAMGLAFARGGQERRAEAMWAEAERLTETIVESDVKSIALSKLGRALAQSGRWEKGKALIHTIEGSEARLVALSELGMLLARAGRWEETESLIQTLTAEES